ncbi:hypothetical protein EAE96_005541 [Botrytis aclada]|nr:hypothetical protein EAE96_005541 [Botrytis aclada]
MEPSSSEIFNAKLLGSTARIIEDLEPGFLGADPLESISLATTPSLFIPPRAPHPTSAPDLPPKKLVRVASQPIPLRTLITLLNYERTTSDWRYENFSLYHSSEMESRTIEEFDDTGYTERARCFCYDDSPYPPDQQIWRQATCRVHPEAPPETRRLNSAQLERAFYESRSADWSVGWELMYLLFFMFCGEGQQVKIQISNERPVLADVSKMCVLHFVMFNPRHLNLNGKHRTPDGVFEKLMLGRCDGSVLVFPPPMMRPSSNGGEVIVDFEDCFVVDMLHMQYGGKGLFEEPYFLGNGRQWQDFMFDNVCEALVHCRVDQPSLTQKQEECSLQMWDWFYEKALRAFHRWIAYDQNSKFLWCDYCGIGGAKLIGCCGEGEEEEMTRYCSEEHRQRGRPLHRFTCENEDEGM